MMRVVTLGIMLLLALAACSKPKITTKEFEAYESRIWAAYCTNDIHAAQKALLHGLQGVSTHESNHVKGIDFDADKALYHERLFLIYRRLGETNKMKAEFEKSMECMSRSRRRWGEPPPPAMTYNEFARELDYRERNVNVRWKTNSQSR